MFASIAIVIALFIIDAIINYRGSAPGRTISIIFDMALEESLAGWFSTIIILFAGITLFFIYLYKRKYEKSFFIKAGWLIISLFFIYMAADDGAEIHEQTGSYLASISLNPFNPLFPYLKFLQRFPSYCWLLLFIPLFSVITLFMIYFFWKELKGTNLRRYIFLALLCYVIAVGLDFSEGLFSSAYQIKPVMPFEVSKNSLIHFMRSVEELLEMSGTIIFWYVFMKYLAGLIKGRGISFEE